MSDITEPDDRPIINLDVRGNRCDARRDETPERMPPVRIVIALGTDKATLLEALDTAARAVHHFYPAMEVASRAGVSFVIGPPPLREV